MSRDGGETEIFSKKIRGWTVTRSSLGPKSTLFEREKFQSCFLICITVPLTKLVSLVGYPETKIHGFFFLVFMTGNAVMKFLNI